VKRKLSAKSFDPPRASRAWNLTSLPTRPAITAMTMALIIKAFDLLLQHFLLLHPKAMALLKFWWFFMLAMPCLMASMAHKTVHVGSSFFGECKCAKMMLVITILSFISH
jgi:hypothetical protein